MQGSVPGWLFRDVTFTGGWAIYSLDFEGQPRVSDWNQQRGHLGIAYHFGTEPVATDRIGDYR